MAERDGVRQLSVDEVLAIHERIVERFGGEHGVRDAGLLESALYRPRTGHYRDLVSMAAALYESLLMSRPFMSRNRALAFFAVDVFLRLNGRQLRVSSPDAERHLTGLEQRGEADYTHLERWLRQIAQPVLR